MNSRTHKSLAPFQKQSDVVLIEAKLKNEVHAQYSAELSLKGLRRSYALKPLGAPVRLHMEKIATGIKRGLPARERRIRRLKEGIIDEGALTI